MAEANFNFYLNRQGVRGQQGAQGPQGFSPIITVYSNTLSEYILQIQTQNNTFLTANLREHKEDLGGTYIRYNRSTGLMYAGDPDLATEAQYGVVRFAAESDIEREASDCVVSPADVANMISSEGYDGEIEALDSRLTIAEGKIDDNAGAIATNTDNIAANARDISSLQISVGGLLADYVPKSRTINGESLSSNITLTAGDVNAYTKSETDTLLNNKADVSDLPDMSNYYTSSQTDSLLDDKADVTDLPGIATTSTVGLVKPDGTSITIDSNGVISSSGGGGGGTTYNAGDGIYIDSSTSTISAKVDGTTINFNADGELESIGGGSSYTEGTGIDITNDVISVDFTDVATAAQGAKADTAVQPSDLATVATTGSYSDLSSKPLINNVELSGGKSLNDLGIANRDLSNLATAGESRLHALKSYKDEGELLTDTEGLSDVTKYAHSTFDASKFTVVGSPIITNDGVASGFAASSSIRTPSITFSSDVVLETAFNLTSLPYYACIVGAASSSTNSIKIAVTISGELNLWLSSNGTTFDIASNLKSSANLISLNTIYYVKLVFNGSTYKLYYRTSDTDYTEAISVASSSTLNNAILQIGCEHTDRNYGMVQGSVDLKQFLITVDGVPVFSGNKTGIDAIKSDDYTVVGTPTISVDGVASGFSSSNYITVSSFPTLNNYTIEGEFTTPATLDNTIPLGIGTLVDGNMTLLFSLRYNSNNRIRLLARNTGGTNTELPTSTKANADTSYKYKIIVNGANCSFYIDNTLVGSLDNFCELLPTLITIGVDRNFSSPFTGSVDLNAFKIYVNGDLTYQPCLKIPYTESKTGSKIVDSYYRARVADMYGQFGYAPYYTLSDSDFTLPQGELYGMMARTSTQGYDLIEIPRIVTETSSAAIAPTFYTVYSDKFCIQGGLCTSGTAVTLLKTFANSNYVLTCPTTAKSSSGFTPSQTSGYIAYGYLA